MASLLRGARNFGLQKVLNGPNLVRTTPVFRSLSSKPAFSAKRLRPATPLRGMTSRGTVFLSCALVSASALSLCARPERGYVFWPASTIMCHANGCIRMHFCCSVFVKPIVKPPV